MNKDIFIELLREESSAIERKISADGSQWIVKGFIDIYRNIYTISSDTKIVSKVLELLLIPMFEAFAVKHGLVVELAHEQNHYPDLTFMDPVTEKKFAVDIKSTYRVDDLHVNGMTLGAYTGYFRNRLITQNTTYPYNDYSLHCVLGIIYSVSPDVINERKIFTLDNLGHIPSVISNFLLFVQPKYKIASDLPGSGNTRNIGSIKLVEQLVSGTGPFADKGEEIYDDYWMNFQNADMARKDDKEKPAYHNFATYQAYKAIGAPGTRKEGEL